MLITILLSILCFLEAFWAAILLSSKHKPINFYFGLTVLSASLWLFSAIMFRLLTGSSLEFWCRTQYSTGALIVTTFLFFTYVFPNGRFTIDFKKRLFIITLLLLVIFMVYYPASFIKGIHIVHPYYKEVSFGKITYPLYAVFIFLFFALAFKNLFRLYNKHQRILREQLNYFIFGTGISAIMGCLFDIILPWFKYFFFWIGTVSTIVMIIFVSYAILKKKLFNIRIILTEMLLVPVAILMLIEFFSSRSFWEYLGRGLLFFLFIFFGYLLIRSVFKEIKLREKLAAANRRLKKLDEEKSDFLNIASHQLRTPMTVIKGYISMIREGMFGKITSEAEEAMNKVYISNERLVKLINDLLDISRIERGKMKYNFQKQNIEQVVRSAVQEFIPVAQHKGLALDYTKPKTKIPEITFDADYIRQVLSNLLDNAIKYTKKGGVKVSLFAVPGAVRIEVQDTGMGLDEKEMENLFKRYHRGLKEGAKGMGLGLYIAKKIIDDHHGKIWAESEGQNKGSTFFIELPI